MASSMLGKVERKTLGALLIMCDENMSVRASKGEIATKMGYKASGGAITFALQSLEMKNFITVEDGAYKVLL